MDVISLPLKYEWVSEREEENLRLIRNIEINYLRSLYSANLFKCGDPIGQEKSFSLRDAEVGTEKWLYARGIPEKLKDLYANNAVKKNFSTGKIDSFAAIIKGALLK